MARGAGIQALGEHDPGASLLVLAVRVGGGTFGLPVPSVERILRMAALTPLPGAGPHVAGVLNVRGDVLPVVDPRSRLGAAPSPPHPEHHLLLMAASPRYLLWVDRAERVVPVPPEQVDVVAADDAGALAPRVARVDGAAVPLLSPDAFAPPSWQPAVAG